MKNGEKFETPKAVMHQLEILDDIQILFFFRNGRMFQRANYNKKSVLKTINIISCLHRNVFAQAQKIDLSFTGSKTFQKRNLKKNDEKSFIKF